jgi:hypothetical protein
MNPAMRKVWFGVIWFVLGHLSCAVMHHMSFFQHH